MIQRSFVAVLFAILPSQEGIAADPQPQVERAGSTGDKPFLVLNVASFERLMSDADAVCRLGERADLSLALRAAVSLPTGGLQGVDRKRPFGLMTVFDPGEAPEPVAIGYVPVADADDFLRMLGGAGFTVRKRSEGDVYDVRFRETDGAMTLQRGYAYFARKAKSLKRTFASPEKSFAKLSKKYDVAGRLDLNAVPDGMKWMIVDYFRARAEHDLRRRTGESASAFRLREAVGRASLSVLEAVAADGRAATLGASLARSPSDSLQIELDVAARPRTKLASALQSASLPQRFAPKDSAARALFLSGSMKPPRFLWPLLEAWFEAAGGAARGPGDERDPALKALLQGLAGNGVQAALWTVPSKAGPPLMAAAFSYPDARRAAPDVDKLLQRLQAAGRLKGVKRDDADRPGLVVHRLTLAGTRFRDALVAVGSQSVWIVAGRGELSTSLIAERNDVKGDSETASTQFLEFSADWSLLRGLLGKRPGDGNRSVGEPEADAPPKPADRVALSVGREKSGIVLRCRLEADVLRDVSRALFDRFAGEKR